MSRFKAATALAMVGFATVALARDASAADPNLSVRASPAPVSLLTSPIITSSTPRSNRRLQPRDPRPDGTMVLGAALALPFQTSTKWPRLGLKPSSFAFRPTPELELGFRSLGKAMGASVQYATPAGVRIGPGLYFNQIAPGAPSARQIMLVLQIPLP
jgi:hypothetical protein